MQTREFPILYGVSSKGVIKQWQVMAIETGYDHAILRKVFGLMGGQLQTNDKLIKGKNIGRVNETTPFEQACKDAESDFKKKKDKNYTEEIPDPNAKDAIQLPMLAHNFEKRGHNIEYPAYGQRKLNGVRCLSTKVSETEIDYRSRKGKPYNDTLQHLTPFLLPLMNVGDTFDGEIFHPDWSFQAIVRRVKKLRQDSNKLQYWVYDLAIEDAPFRERMATLNYRFHFNRGGTPTAEWPIVNVQTVMLNGPDDVAIFHDKFANEGFEGLIIRNAAGLYKFGHRSADLQKYKKFFEDEEYKIVGGTEGEGNDAGCVVFEIEIPGMGTQAVRPKGTVAHRQKMFNELPSLIGKMLTVKYQEKSEDGKLIFPVGLVIRDYE